MAKWNTDVVHQPESINNGNQYEIKDRPTIEQLNALAENSFYAAKTSKEAIETANSAEKKIDNFIETKGDSVVTINGVPQPTWSADFAESERQKSKNLFDISNVDESLTNYVSIEQNDQQIIFTSTNSVSWFGYKIPVEIGKQYTISVANLYYTESEGLFIGNSDGRDEYSYGKLTRDVKTMTITTNTDTLYIKGYTSYSNIGITFTIDRLQIEEGATATNHQPYNGQITHNGYKPVVFAESERQKSKNLWSYGNVSGIKSTAIHFEKPLGTESFAFSFMCTATDTDSDRCLIEFYDESGHYVAGDTCERDRRTSFVKTFNKPVKSIHFYASTTFAGSSGDSFTFSDIQIEAGSQATDYQPYNGAIVHEKQLSESIDKRELVFDYSNYINIYDSTLTTLREFFDLFTSDVTQTYYCQVGAITTNNFKQLVGTPTGFGNYCACLIKYCVNGSGTHRAFELLAYNNLSNGIAKGYIWENASSTVVFTGWNIIGG